MRHLRAKCLRYLHYLTSGLIHTDTFSRKLWITQKCKTENPAAKTPTRQQCRLNKHTAIAGTHANAICVIILRQNQRTVNHSLSSCQGSYHSRQNFLPYNCKYQETSSRICSRKMPAARPTKTEIHRSIILATVLYGCKTWSVTLREEQAEDALEKGAEK
jgi:hypothetical protein